jgi:tryptophan synthase
VAYVTAGFPTREETVPILLALEAGGADVIEVGVPFSDPLADGPTIQKANQIALENGVDSLEHCLNLVSLARQQGLKVPIVFMGYYNPFLAYGELKIAQSLFPFSSFPLFLFSSFPLFLFSSFPSL